MSADKDSLDQNSFREAFGRIERIRKLERKVRFASFLITILVVSGFALIFLMGFHVVVETKATETLSIALIGSGILGCFRLLVLQSRL